MMDISVGSGGEIKINVTYKDRVPDLLSRFPQAVQRRARRFLHWPSAYERKVWRASKGMPRWARETVRQHLLHERAEWISQRLQKLAEKRQRRDAVIAATRRVVEAIPTLVEAAKTRIMPVPRQAPASVVPGHVDPVPTPAPVVSARSQAPPVGGARHASGSALGAPVRGRLTLTERLAQEHGVEPAWPRAARNVQDHGRGR